MSTRRKTGGSVQGFLDRRHTLHPVRDRFMLSLRMIREALAQAEATVDHWGEFAGMVNVAGLYAMEKKRQDWLAVILPAADALRSIEARNERVGGRYVSLPAETAPLTTAINLIDSEILLHMPAVDFLRLATYTNSKVPTP